MALSQAIELPELVIASPLDGVQVGTPRLRWRGEFLDIPTLNNEPWTVRLSDAEFTSVTVRIPVRVVIEES